jgi:hypothetical protein
LFTGPRNTGRFEDDTLGFDRNAPALFAQVGYKKAYGPQFDAVAVVNITSSQRAKCICETRGEAGVELQYVMKLLPFAGRKIGRESAEASGTEQFVFR